METEKYEIVRVYGDEVTKAVVAAVEEQNPGFTLSDPIFAVSIDYLTGVGQFLGVEGTLVPIEEGVGNDEDIDAELGIEGELGD
jgi:hypothetical protein